MKIFKLNKAIGFTIKQEVLDSINHYAVAMGLYDNRLNLESQCHGYHAFKELCFLSEALNDNISNKPGYHLMRGIHPVLREQAWAAAKVVRKRHNIFQDSKTKENEQI